MTSPTNKDRVARAEAAICAYQILGPRDPDEAMIDLITDVMHWAEANGADFQLALHHAQFHVDAEVQP